MVFVADGERMAVDLVGLIAWTMEKRGQLDPSGRGDKSNCFASIDGIFHLKEILEIIKEKT